MPNPVGSLRPARALGLGFCLALLAVGGCGGPAEGGPVDVANVDSVSYPFKVGVTGAVGATVVFNRGDRDAVLLSARPLGATPGLKVVRALVAGPNRKLDFWCCVRSWAPGNLLDIDVREPRPIRGAVLEPTKDVESDQISGANLIFLIRAEEAGAYSYGAIDLRYRVGDEEYRRVIRAGFRGCFVERVVPGKHCPAGRAVSEEEAARLQDAEA